MMKKRIPASERKVISLFEPCVREWITRSFDRLTPPQIQAWPLIAEQKNTLVFAPTGSGKTLAAFLWSINDLFRAGLESSLEEGVHVLYVSPLKALNNDIQKNLMVPLDGIAAIGKEMGLRLPKVNSLVRTGDTSAADRTRMAKHPPHILITTPESLYIMLTTEKFRERLRTIRYVIVDEIHALFDNKRGTQLALALERLSAFIGRDPVRIGCSATQSSVQEVARFLAGWHNTKRARECTVVDIGSRKNLDVLVVSPVSDLLEAQFDKIWNAATRKVVAMAKKHNTTLIFTNSRYRTERLTLNLQDEAGDALRVGSHHGSMSKEVRLDMEKQLKSGALHALVATSSLELGIDVGSVDIVCQTQSPKSIAAGIQRVGRAGHLLSKTSKGRLLPVDKDDLAESAAAVRGIMEGRIDSGPLPTNCLDMLAQHIVACCAADEWPLTDLYKMCRRAHPFHNLKRPDFDAVVRLLSGEIPYLGDKPVYPKIHWNRVENTVRGARGARLSAFRCGGAIPDVSDYTVVHAAHKSKIGTVDEAFVEKLHPASVFVLGNTTWRVTRVRRNRVYVNDAHGVPPTIPYWGGDRPSRTYELGLMVGELRETVSGLLDQHQAGTTSDKDILLDLRRTYRLDTDGARAILSYFGEQHALMGVLPSHKRIVVESFTNQMGQQQIVIHSVFGIRVNDAWMMALQRAILSRHGFAVQGATVDDGILLTPPEDKWIDPNEIISLIPVAKFDGLVDEAILDSPIFASRFRHNAVRAMMVLREYRGRRTPVWAQNFRASAILEHVGRDLDFPIVKETLRECRNAALDGPGARQVLKDIATQKIAVEMRETQAPSPFCHSLLLVGQYGDFGGMSSKERHSRLMHLHRDVLKQLLSKDELKSLLRQEVVEDFVSRRQHTHPDTQAKDEDEIVDILSECGSVSIDENARHSIDECVSGDVPWMLRKLWHEKRIMQIPVGDDIHWIATHDFPVFRAALERRTRAASVDETVLDVLRRQGQLTTARLGRETGLAERRVAQSLSKLSTAFLIVRAPGKDDQTAWARAADWLP